MIETKSYLHCQRHPFPQILSANHSRRPLASAIQDCFDRPSFLFTHHEDNLKPSPRAQGFSFPASLRTLSTPRHVFLIPLHQCTNKQEDRRPPTSHRRTSAPRTRKQRCAQERRRSGATEVSTGFTEFSSWRIRRSMCGCCRTSL